MTYLASQFTSIHQISGITGGLREDWPPAGVDKTYRASSTNVNLRQWKVFVPPGITQASVTMNVGQASGSAYNFVARIGQPPGSDPHSGSNDGYQYADLVAADCFGSNSSGYVFIWKSEGGLHLTEGKWLYIDFEIVSGNLQTTSVVFVVEDEAVYEDWYDNDVVWDSNGDPIQGAIPAPSGDFYPVPTSLSFGYVAVGASASRAVIIYNTTTAAINVTSVALPSDFTAWPDLGGGNVPASSNVVIFVTFTPTEAKTYSGDFELDAGDNDITIPMTGTSSTAPAPAPSSTKHLQVGKYILVRGGVAVIENADIGALWSQLTPSSIGLTYDSTHEWNVGDPETTRTIKVEVLDQYGNALRISGLIQLELKFGSGTIYSADTGWSASLVSQTVTNASYYTFTYKRNQAATEHSPVFLATIMITVQLMKSFNITLLDVGGEPIY